jgi:hypothetical protein
VMKDQQLVVLLRDCSKTAFFHEIGSLVSGKFHAR